MNCYDEISQAFSDKPVFTRGELNDYIKRRKPMLKDNSIGWLLYDLCQKRVIQRIAHNAYRLYVEGDSLKNYQPSLSDDAADMLEFIREKFPLITFIIWETRAFNEFANHQLARNFIFVEVEKPLSESVFNSLHERGAYTTLYKPSEKEIALYSGDVTVSVLPLTSEPPIDGNNAKLEKMLVDLFASKLLDRIISRSDYIGIYEEAFARYNVNYNLMLRYAKRRSRDDEIKSFIKNKTSIAVIGKDVLNDKS